MSDKNKTLILWIIVGVVVFSLMSNFSANNMMSISLPYSKFIEQVQSGGISKVVISDHTINGTLNSGQSFNSYMPIPDQKLLDELIQKDIVVVGKPPQQQSLLLHIFINWFPFLLLIGIYIFFMRQVSGKDGGGPLSFGKSRARKIEPEKIDKTFDDVQGCDEAKEEISEIVDFLRDPGKYQQLGGKIPNGALLVGPPGTGKTLLAKAVAGEAGVPFFTISGSDFVEMFVGVGARRVRELYKVANEHAPCIIFIDEIDAVGRRRGAGLGGGHDEREQTLNQLLIEMDGFGENNGVIVLAATNRPDVLDPALLRPGRFDRQVVIGLPDISGREKILEVHMRPVTLAKDTRADLIARGTPGFSGADLANLVNQAVLLAARDNCKNVNMLYFDKAKDKIMMGAERKSMIMSPEEKELTAYHEAGHTIVGLMSPEHDPVYKVSIIPRGRALGVTMYLPEQDRYSYSKQRLESQLASLFGGRLAEEIIYGAHKVTTGASNDIERATEIARNMVTKWGLDDETGPINYGSAEQEIFLGRDITQHKDFSDKTACLIDQRVKNLIDVNYKRAEKILKSKIKELHAMTEALVKYETIGAEQIEDIMAGLDPRPPAHWHEHDEPPVAKKRTRKPRKTTKKADEKADEKENGKSDTT